MGTWYQHKDIHKAPGDHLATKENPDRSYIGRQDNA